MQKSLSWIVLIIAAIAITLSLIAILDKPANQRLAYIVNSEILENYPPAMEARAMLNNMGQAHQQKIDSMSISLQTMQNVLNKDNTNKKLQTEMQEKGSVLQNYIQQAQQQMTAFETQKMDSVYQLINEGITAFAEENGYRMILGTLNGNIVYADSADNVTDAVINYLSKKTIGE